MFALIERLSSNLNLVYALTEMHAKWEHIMKKFCTFIFAIALSFTYLQAGSSQHQDEHEVMIVDFINVKDLSSEMLMDIMTGKLPNLAIEFSEGNLFPLELFLDGDLISLVKSEDVNLSVRFNRTVLLRNNKGKLLFSTDLKCWRPFRGFTTGTLQAGINVDHEETGPVISFGVELNEREHSSSVN